MLEAIFINDEATRLPVTVLVGIKSSIHPDDLSGFMSENELLDSWSDFCSLLWAKHHDRYFTDVWIGHACYVSMFQIANDVTRVWHMIANMDRNDI